MPLLDILPLALILLILILVLIRDRHRCYPPGPKGYPVIGSIDYMSKVMDLSVSRQLAEKYGEVVHFHVFGRHFVYLNSTRAAIDLLQKRSNNYSNRFQQVMSRDLVGWGWAFGTMNIGSRWKRHRRTFERPFRESQAPLYWDIQRDCARKLLVDLLGEPSRFMDHFRLVSARSIMKTTYGIEVKDMTDQFVSLSEKASETMNVDTHFYLVNFIPALKWIPAWFPGAAFQRKAQKWRQVLSQMRDCPFEVAAAQSSSSALQPTFVSLLLGERGEGQEEVEIIKNSAGQAYIGGVDSFTTALSTFLRAMTLYPEAQKKAQDELDRVCQGRFPDFGDRKSLPQLEALYLECLRWHPVAPLGIPHLSKDDDVYNGHFIPAGSMVFANIGYILRDEEKFPNPLEFNPDRFLDKNTESIDPRDVVFGFGKRICPGRFVADSLLWICIASILSVFEISSVPGADIMDVVEHKDDVFAKVGIIGQALPFECSIVPRRSRADELLSEVSKGLS